MRLTWSIAPNAAAAQVCAFYRRPKGATNFTKVAETTDLFAAQTADYDYEVTKK